MLNSRALGQGLIGRLVGSEVGRGVVMDVGDGVDVGMATDKI